MVTQLSGRCLPQSDCQWLYKIQSAGQLNGGSGITLNISVGENCKVVFTTQEYPKVSANKCVAHLIKQNMRLYLSLFSK